MKSEATPGPYTPELLIQDLIALWDHLGIKKSHVLGLGLGGSLRWARGRVRDPGGLFISGVLVIPERRNADELVFSPFVKYSARFGRVRWTGQLNVDNALDRQRVLALPRSTTGAIRYFQYQYSPRKFALTTSVTF